MGRRGERIRLAAASPSLILPNPAASLNTVPARLAGLAPGVG
jgi:hypothetical protein